MAYPASLDGSGWTEYRDLVLLVSEPTQTAYRQFTTEFGGSVFVYADIPSGAFVLNVHSGRLKGSGQALEAEPLRQMIEGDLYSPLSREKIAANLEKLLGRTFVFSQESRRCEFVVTRAERMDNADRIVFESRPGDLSEYLGGLAEPERSFLLVFCSGRQPDEPNEPFPGYIILCLTAAEQ